MAPGPLSPVISQADLRYTCPVCMDSLFPPVFQCRNGHLICEGCSSRLNNCGVCRVTLPRVHRVRNLEVEKIIRMTQHPCPNDGCQAKLNFDQLDAHRIECQHSKFPICEMLFGLRDCEEVRIYDYEEHYERKHGHKLAPDPVTLPADALELVIEEFDENGFWCYKLEYENKTILLIFMVEIDAPHNLVKFKPWVLARKAESNQLNCKISFISGTKVNVSIFNAPIFNLESKKEELLDCAGISRKYLQSILLSSREAGSNVARIKLWKKTGTLLNDQASSAMDISST